MHLRRSCGGEPPSELCTSRRRRASSKSLDVHFSGDSQAARVYLQDIFRSGVVYSVGFRNTTNTGPIKGDSNMSTISKMKKLIAVGTVTLIGVSGSSAAFAAT